MLRLQTESATVVVRLAAFSLFASVEEIGGVQLNARLCGQYIQYATTVRIEDFGGQHQARLRPIKHIAVIVSFAKLDLGIIGVDARADRRRLREI